MKTSINLKELLIDYGISFIAGICVAFGIYYFSQYNGFAPGGLTGLSSILSWYTSLGAGYYLFIFNIPILILVCIFVEAKMGINCAFYIIVQSVFLIIFENIDLPYYKATEGNLIFACLGAGVVTGAGYGLQLRRNGGSSGTYAISVLIKHWNPAANIAWLSFVMDISVVFLVFFLKTTSSVESAIATIANLFLANVVVDAIMRGSKEGYRFEIITDSPEEISKEIMDSLMHGVTEMRVQGMYTHVERYMIICIIRTRELSKMLKILKKYKGTFASFSRVNEVLGKFKK